MSRPGWERDEVWIVRAKESGAELGPMDRLRAEGVVARGELAKAWGELEIVPAPPMPPSLLDIVKGFDLLIKALDEGKGKVMEEKKSLAEMRGRAITGEQKHALVKRLFAAWYRVPDLRFGQLIGNVFRQRAIDTSPPQGVRYQEAMVQDLYYTEDEAFIEAVEKWVAEHVAQTPIVPRDPPPGARKFG